MQIACRGIVSDVSRICGFRYREDRGPACQEPQSNLTWRRTVPGSDLRQHPAPSRARMRKIAMPEWTVGHDGDVMGLAPGEHSVFDRALLEMVEDLVAGDPALPGDGQ